MKYTNFILYSYGEIPAQLPNGHNQTGQTSVMFDVMFLLSFIPQFIVSVTHCGNSLTSCRAMSGTVVVFVVCSNVL